MQRAWRAERIWDGKTAVIVAGGPSVTTAQIRLIGMARERDLIRVIAVNDAIYLGWWADVAYACDAKWWKFHGRLRRFAGQRVGLQKTDYDEVGIMRISGGEGFDPDPTALRTGSNGGYQAVHLAVHFGASRIILVGFDMRGTHWFGEHPPLVMGSQAPMDVFQKRFATLAPILSGMGVRVENASPGSELKVFPSVDLALELTALEKTMAVTSKSLPSSGNAPKVVAPLRPAKVGKKELKNRKTRDMKPGSYATK